MKHSLLALLLPVAGLLGCAAAPTPSASTAAAQVAPGKPIRYTASGSASVDIQRPADAAFRMLTNASQWPDINRGVTKAVTPAQVKLAPGVRFRESIASPVPGVKDWTNEWLVESFEPGKRFVISGLDNFSSTPIHSRITYQFAAQGPQATTFTRTIDVAIDEHFMRSASKAEIEALFRFLGSQWEMAMHLKRYVEAQPAP